MKKAEQKKLVDMKIIESKDRTSDHTRLVCTTCYSYVVKNKVPSIWVGNGFGLNQVPKPVMALNPMERHLVALRMPFMQIVSAQVGGQKKLRGKVVNVPLSVEETLKFLPRSLDQTHVIAVQLKRKTVFKHWYLSMNVSPAKVWTALQALRRKSLYLDVKEDAEWMEKTTDLLFDTGERDEDAEVDEEEAAVGSLETCLFKNDMIAQIAPGEGKSPLFILMDPHAEEKAFPHLFGGEPRQHPDAMKVYPQIIRSELQNKKRIFAHDVSNLFFKLFVHTIRSINNAINFISFRKTKGEAYTAEQVVSTEFIREKVRRDEAFRSCLSSVVNSPAYFDNEKNKVMGMIRQLGKPTIFLTLSPCERDWKELHVILKEAHLERKLTEDELESVDELTNHEKDDLLKNDPVTCATYFNHRFLAMFKVIRHEKGIFADHPVANYYYRVEYQQRGSPHVHMLVWLDKVPNFDPKNPSTFSQMEQLVDKYISCSSDHEFASYHRHHHTFTCFKTKKDAIEKRCRFNIPYPPMVRTQILTPLVVGVNTDRKTHERRQEKWIRLRTALCMHVNENIPYSEVLKGMGVTHEEYINVLRTSIRRPTVFLKREWKDRKINGYNKNILNEWQANSDMQIILDPYGLVHYLVNYINKSQKGMSEIMRNVRDQMMKAGNEDLRKQMKEYGKAFVDVHEISAPEAVYTCLGMNQCKASVACEYVNTAPPKERTRVLKPQFNLTELAEKDPKSTDVFRNGLIEYYQMRPSDRHCDKMCLADFATRYEFDSKDKKKKSLDKKDISEDEEENEENDDDDDDQSKFPESFECGNKVARRRPQKKILRHRRYNEIQDPTNYYRENLMLYIPWRDETKELLNVKDIEAKYRSLEKEIIKKRIIYNKVSEDVLLEELAIAEAIESEEYDPNRLGNGNWVKDEEYFMLDDPNVGKGIDVVFGDDEEVDDNPVPDKYSFVKNPIMLNPEEFHDLVAPLNVQQRRLFYHYVHELRQQMYTGNRYPRMHYFVTGPAGAGKSHLIKAITQATIRIACRSKAVLDFESMKIILTAPTGKAAFNIGGTTAHSCFNLPVHKFETVPPLSADVVNSLFSRMADVKPIIVDEISMLSRDNFGLMDKRLRQIFGRSDEWFGGLNVIVFGDFYQLPPVGAASVFSLDVSSSNADPYDFINGPCRWGLFKFFELNQIMRQKDDLTFAERLTRFGRGKATKEDCQFFESLRRPQHETLYDDDYVHLFYSNKEVDHFNEVALSMIKGREVTCPTVDVGDELAVKQAPYLTRKQKFGLLDEVFLKENARYMVILNVDTEDGLVNGGIGVLRDWEFESQKKDPTKKRVSRIWMQFDDKHVGHKARTSTGCERSKKGWTPIDRRNAMICVKQKKTNQIVKFVRIQFPVVAAMALTYHKSQGGTYNKVAVHISKFAERKCSAVYVALSRVTSSAGLIIFTHGDVTFPFPGPQPAPAVIREMERLSKHEQLTCVYDHMPQSPFALSFNVRSLRKHANDIINDPVLMSPRLMFLMETGLRADDKVCIPTFKELERICAVKNRKRGLSFFVREDTKGDVKVLPPPDPKNEPSNDCEHIRVLYKNRIMVNGVYWSPSMTEAKKKKLLKMFGREANDNGWVIVVMGDFNTCFKTKAWTDKLAEWGYRILITAPTHDAGGCIDNVLTSSEKAQAVIYESVCSDHRPIFVHRLPEPTKDYPFATASLTTDFCAANRLNQVNNRVSFIEDPEVEDDENKISDYQTSDEESIVDATDLTESLANVNLMDRSMIHEAEELLNEVRPLIFSDVNDNVPFDEWRWKKIIDEHTSLCEEVLLWVRQKASERHNIRGDLVRLSPDTNACRHLAAPIRHAYHPIRTSPDGSCYFNAVSLLLCGDESLRRTLRLLSLYIFIKHRESYRIVAGDDTTMLEECRRTCIVATDPQCQAQVDCWVDFMNSFLMCQILLFPIIIIDYSHSFELAGNDVFSSCQSLSHLNERIRACRQQNQSGIHTQRFSSYAVNQDHLIKEPFVMTLSASHFTALVKSTPESGNIQPFYNVVVNIPSD